MKSSPTHRVKIMKLPSTVQSVNTVVDQGGDYIEITFKNGSVVRVSAENDGIHYYSPKNIETIEDNPTVSLMVDFGSGHHLENPDRVGVVRWSSCERLTLNEY